MSVATLPGRPAAGKPACPDLKALFGRRYRVRHEESYYAERSQFRAAEEAWLQVMPCRGTPRNCPTAELTVYTHIDPWGKGTLADYKAGRSTSIIRRLVAIACRLRTAGDDGTTLLFPVALFPRVAEIIRPLRRRVASEAERERLRRLSHAHSPLRRRPITETPETGLVCVGRAPVDVLAMT